MVPKAGMCHIVSNNLRPNVNLRVANFNACSILAHINQIQAYFHDNFYHVIPISETWLHAGVQDALINMNDYYIIRNDRVGKVGGGVACYIHCSLKVKLIDASTGPFCNAAEFLMLEIILPSGEIILFVSMYRRPKGQLFNNFITSFNRVSHAYKNIIITGNLNCNLLSDSFESGYLKELLYSLSLYPVPSDATHHTEHSHTLLDIFIIDSSDKVIDFQKSETPFINGHDLIELTYELVLPAIPTKKIERRCIKYFNDRDYLVTLGSLLLSPMELEVISQNGSEQVDTLISSLEDALITALDRHAPIKTFFVNKPPKLWLTDQLKSQIKEKNRLYKKANRGGSVLDFDTYRIFRDNLTIELRQAKDNYLATKLFAINDSKCLWRELRILGLVKPTLTSPHHFFTSEELNTFYVSITASHPPLSFEEFQMDILSLPLPQITFNFSIITEAKIVEHLNATNSLSLSAGNDKISLFCLKKSMPLIIPHLSLIFNSIINQSKYPSGWGVARIRPLSKIKTPKSPSDTRPVANLPEPSKLFERILFEQITDFVEANDLFDPCKSGFRSTYSTQTALIRVTDDIRAAIDERKITILVLFDFSKAFDLVPHNRLLIKLRSIGFSDSALSLVYSYLTGRIQSVIDEEGIQSSWRSTTRGVPQGSVLGPILFSLFIRDIGDNLRYSKRMLFADDTQIYLHCYPSQLNDALAKITCDARAIAEFADSNGLSLNITKSKALILGSQAYVRTIDLNLLPPITVGEEILLFDSTVRNLGVQLSTDLSWRSQVASISQKVHATLHKLKFHKNSLSTELRIKLVSTLIIPHFDYCCLVYLDLSDEMNSKLQVLANNCIRFIYDLRRDEHITPYRLRLRWLTIKQRRLYFLGIMTFKILRQHMPHYLIELMPRGDDTLRRSTRLPVALSTFFIPNHRTEAFHRSFRLTAAYFWNSLPVDVSGSVSLGIFKTKLFTHLFNTN